LRWIACGGTVFTVVADGVEVVVDMVNGGMLVVDVEDDVAEEILDRTRAAGARELTREEFMEPRGVTRESANVRS
jgi:hypothetical protein